MYVLQKLTSDLFRITELDTLKILAQGNFKELKLLAEAQGFTDLEFAVQIMDENNHDAADFGILKSFIYSFNKHKLVS